MERLLFIVGQIRSLIQRKLGRCGRCMRWSFVATALAWGLFAFARFGWGNAVLGLAILTLASAFTGLFTAHIVAFAIRSVRAGARPTAGVRAADLTRRELVVRLARAGLAGVLVSVLGRPLRVSAGGFPINLGCNCDKVPNGFIVIRGFATKEECEQNGIPQAFSDAVQQADEFCNIENYKCVDPNCPELFFNIPIATTMKDRCRCAKDPENPEKWRAECDLLDKTKCCCRPQL